VCVFLPQATTQNEQEDVVVVVEHEVSEEGMREMKMTPSKVWFVSYAMGGQVHQRTGILVLIFKYFTNLVDH
jgi:hypothetical protein